MAMASGETQVNTIADADTAGARAGADEELAFLGLPGLARLLGAGELTPRELSELYLRRIERLDPRLHAFVSLRADEALAEAEAALVRLRGGERGALLGIPVAVKDNLDIAGMPTGHGVVEAGESAASDCEVVRRLKQAGAIILGKTTLCELAAWGHFTSSRACGVTRNPWNLTRSPGGSSGGSAAAVAAGLVPVALGSDGGGSIRIPAAFCGLFGLKPQRGRIPLAPLRDHWHGCTVLGGLGRSVLDVAILDDAIRGALGADAAEPPEPAMEFAEAARREPGRLRVAYSTKPPIPGVKAARANLEAVEATAELLRTLGHEVAECELAHPQLLTSFTPRWAAGVAEDARSRRGLLERRTRQLARLGRVLSGRALRRSLAREQAAARRLNEVFDEHDLVMTPTTAAAAPSAEISSAAGAFRSFNQGSPYVCFTPTWNFVGQPAASVPAGFDADGLPLAVQLAGPANSETTIISLAAQVESVRPWAARRPDLDTISR